MTLLKRFCSLTIVIFSLLAVSLPTYALPKDNKKCEELLSPESARAPSPAEITLNKLTELRNTLDQMLGSSDPFLATSDLSETASILNKLSFTKSATGENVPNILSDIRKTLRNGNIQQEAVQNHINHIFKISAAQLSDASTKKKDLITLKLSAEILAGLYVQVFPRETPPTEETKGNEPEKEKKEKKEKKKDQPKAPPPEFVPELPEEYEVKSDDQDNEGGQQEKAVFYEFNEKANYFKQVEYNFLTRSHTNYKVMPLPFRQDESVPSGSSQYKMRVVTKGARNVKLFLPTGYVPLSPTGFGHNISLIKAADGSYRMTTSGQEQEVTLPMTPLPAEILNATDLEVLTSPLGVADNEWPDPIRLHIIGKKFSNEIDAATSVANFIKSKFLYSKKAMATDPIEAIQAGQFKCDMAALIMTSLMRDHFKMPCRVVGGYRADKHKGASAPNSLLVLPTDPHAWVECYAGGQWQTYDPTPTKQAPGEDEQDTEASDFVPQQDSEKDQSLEPAPSQDSEGTDSKNNKDEKKQSEDDSAEAGDKKDETKEKGKEKGKEKAKVTDNTPSELKLGNLSLAKSGGTTNPLIRELVNSFFRESFAPHLPQNKLIENLGILSSAQIGKGWAQIDQLMSGALAQLSSVRPAVAQHLRQIVGRIKTTPIEQTYKEFYSSWYRMQAHQALLTDPADSKMANDIQNAFIKAENEFRKLETASATEVKQAIGFLRGLPAITRSVIVKDYNITVPGNNAATIRLGADLKSGKLSHIALIEKLYPMTDFITEPISVPMYRQAKNWNYLNKKGRDLMLMTDASNLMRGISLDPSKSKRENYINGTLIDPRRRQVIKIPSKTGVQEPERISMVLYDTSGSMNGSPGDFQAALIAAFADRALSDKTKDGRQLHKLMVMGFDEKVHTSIPLSTSAQAQSLIREYRSKMSNTSKGTNIMEALREAFAQIEAAQKTKGEPLANANIILMTDGQADIDIDKIIEMRSKINERTRVQLLFVGINNTDAALQEFCYSDAKHKANLAKTGYYYFSPSVISETINKAIRSQDEVSKDVLVSDTKSTEIPENLSRELMAIASLTDIYEGRLKLRQNPDLSAMYKAVDTQVNTSIVRSENRELRLNINGVRSLLGAKSSSNLRKHSGYRYVTLTFLQRFTKLAKKELSQLTIEEAEELKHLMREINAQI